MTPEPPTLELVSGDLVADYAPSANMVACSLRHRGEQLLGLRGGLDAYLDQGKTFGVPLLYPWANRLGEWRYAAEGQAVALDRDGGLVRGEEHGLPIHGVLARALPWQVTEREPDALSAGLDWGARPELMAVFPFPHTVQLDVALEPDALRVRVTVRAGPDGPVPLAFGFHPYLAPPGAPREQWDLELPARTALALDDRGLPTGAASDVTAERVTLGERTYDDLFAIAEGETTFAVTAGGRRLAVEYGAGYPYAQVFAPPGHALVCFEPMTAPTDALRTHDGLRAAPAGGTAVAEFTLRVGAL